MLLAININNTETKVGLFRGESLESHWRLTTTPQRTPDEWAATLTAYLAQAGGPPPQTHAPPPAPVPAPPPPRGRVAPHPGPSAAPGPATTAPSPPPAPAPPPGRDPR